MHHYILLILIHLYMGIDTIFGYTHWRENKETVCEYRDFTAQCPGQSNIIIKEAEYGHIGISECVEVDTNHFGCKLDVLDVLDEKCSGKQSCKIAENDLRHLNPCRKGLHVFLQFSYICVAADRLQPCQPNTITPKLSFISSKQSGSGKCGSMSQPTGTQFNLNAKPGQKIKISALKLNGEISRSHNNTRLVGYVVDEGQDKAHPVEVNLRREGLVPLMQSKSSEITISIQGPADLQFLIFFEAVGCENLKQPDDSLMWVERHGDQTTVGCSNSNSRRTWNLQCIGVQWVGVIGNCTAVDLPEAKAVVSGAEVVLAIPKEIILMIIIGATLVLALVIITVGYVFYKRTLDPLEPQEDPTVTHNNLKVSSGPVLPEKRQATLLRSHGSLLRQQPRDVLGESVPWEPSVPPPPPRRDNTIDIVGSVQAVESVPLRSGDLLLDNGTDTILVRGNVGQNIH